MTYLSFFLPTSNQEKTKGKIILQIVALKLQIFENLSLVKDNEGQKPILYILFSIKFDRTQP